MKKKVIGAYLSILVGLIGLIQYLHISPVHHTYEQPAVIMEVLDPSLEQFAPMWRTEISRRFPHAVGVLVHGGDFVESQWIIGTSLVPYRHVTPVSQIVHHYQEMYPDRTLVLLACNTGHLKLDIPGVYYASSSVWCVPDRALKAGDINGLLKLSDAYMDPGGDPFTPFVPAPPRPHPTRWEIDPDVVGNIFEFQAD